MRWILVGVYLLHANAHPRAATERHKIFFQVLRVWLKPPFWAELGWVEEEFGVVVRVPDVHTYGDLIEVDLLVSVFLRGHFLSVVN